MTALLTTHLADLLRPWLERGPRYATLATGLRALALDGRLPVGTRLPSERELATALSLGRNTVTAAYNLLREDGYLLSSHGAGSRVAVPRRLPARPDPDPEPLDDVLDLTVAALPAPGVLLDAVRAAGLSLSPLLAGHGLHPLGIPDLRAAIAGRLSARGLMTRIDQVLVTNGALHGWDLVLRSFAHPGQRVLVEQPTYPSVIDAVLAHRLRPVAVPVTARGWDVPTSVPGLAHLTPDGQNPTGLVATDAQRRSMSRVLHGSMLVVDESFADLVLEGPVQTPMAALHRSILTVGTMSKAFWAGLRIGWVRAEPDVVVRLAQARAGQDLASPVLDQLVAVELLARADEILLARRQQLRRSRDALLEALARELPEWRYVVPRAGMVLWVELPGTSATALAAQAMELGVRLTAGPRFTLRGTADRWLRLPFTLPAEQMSQVGALLRDAAHRAAEGPPSRHTLSRWTA